MARILMVIAPKNFRDEEYFTPKTILETAGHEITTGSKVLDEIRSTQGKATQSTVRAGDETPYDYGAIIFVGGPGMNELVDDFDFTNVAKRFAEAGKLIAAICVAPAILANAGILQNKKATSWEGAKNTLEEKGANYTGESITIDGNIITAIGPEAAEEFAHAIVDHLKKDVGS